MSRSALRQWTTNFEVIESYSRRRHSPGVILPSSGVATSQEVAAVTPQSAGWYDDPDSAAALRYFDGHEWTPQRKRKPPAAARPAPTDPYISAPSMSQSSPYGPAYQYPADPGDAVGAPPPAYSGDPYAPSNYFGTAVPHGSADNYPPLAAGPGAQYSTFPPAGRSSPWLGMGAGTDRIIGIIAILAGVALAVTPFFAWGRATGSAELGNGTFASITLSFPGFGDPTLAMNMSGDDGTSLRGKVDIPQLHAMHSTNPGWIAFVLGLVAIIAGVAYLWLRYRLIVAVAIAVVSGIAVVILLSQLLDLSGTFGGPPGVPADKFSPGPGLVAACLLAFVLAAASIATAIVQWRQQYRNASV